MARASRIALDLALVSVKFIQPTVSKLWYMAKSAASNTVAKPLVVNSVVNKVEFALDRMTGLLVSKLISLRNDMLPKEEKYLERELEKVRKMRGVK